MAHAHAVQARWVSDWSLDPRYLAEFSGLIIKLVFIFPLICGIIILIRCVFAGSALASPFPRCLWTELGSPAGIRIHFTVLLFSFAFLPGGCCKAKASKSDWAYLRLDRSSAKGHIYVQVSVVKYCYLGSVCLQISFTHDCRGMQCGTLSSSDVSSFLWVAPFKRRSWSAFFFLLQYFGSDCFPC